MRHIRNSRFQNQYGPKLRSVVVTLLTFASTCVVVVNTLIAQSIAPQENALAAPTTAVNPSQSWELVQQVTPNTRLKIAADKGGGECALHVVTADALVCAHGSSTRSVSRAEIRSIKLARKGRSTAIGLAAGLGIGAAAGVGVGSAINSSDSGSFVHVSGGKAAGVGAAIGVILGGASGALIGYATDLAAGPVIYRR